MTGETASPQPSVTSTTNNNNKERLLLFHTPDPTELGIQLSHCPDGHVRILFKSNASEIANNSLLEGSLHPGDVVCEAAGVNMRHPISDHMWKLTKGLMMVAPRPIEVRVCHDGIEEESDKKSSDKSYYQLEVGEQTPTEMNAVLLSAQEQQGPLTPPTPISTAIRNPFQDVGRFGSERRIVFHTQSLGVKLHRSPTEGIVHILHVTPFKPFGTDSERIVREGPNNGHLESGDTIFEVGGVDLRNKVIGQLEWADMVHFIKHVGRPLDMVIAKDKLFTRERAGAATGLDKVVSEVQSQVEEAQQRERDESMLLKEEEEEKKEEDKENQEEDEEEEPFTSNVCFNINTDDVCALPCTGGEEDVNTTAAINTITGISIAPSSSPRDDSSWIKKFDHGKSSDKQKDDTIVEKKEEDTKETENEVTESPKVKAHPWIKEVVDSDSVSSIEEVYNRHVENIVVKDTSEPKAETKSPSSTSGSMSFYSRTHPTGKSSVITSPCVVLPPSNKDTPKSPDDEEDNVDEEKKSVAQLKTMFSPVRNPVSGEVTTATIDTVPSTPASPEEEDIPISLMLQPTPGTAKKEKEKVKELYSPIVMDTPGQEEGEEIVSSPEGADVSPLSDASMGSNNDSQIVGTAEECFKDLAKRSPSDKRNVLAQSILKEKRNSPVNKKEVHSPSTDNVVIQVPQLEATPPKPFDETNNSSFGSAFFTNLKEEFNSSPDKKLQASESRDDEGVEGHSSSSTSKKQFEDFKILSKPDKSNYTLSGGDLSPAGSTISVEDKTPDLKKSNTTPARFFSERSFHAMDGAVDSPFVGNIKFATPNQRVPASALFAQAFVVQHQSSANGVDAPVTRWVQTDSPLFVVKKEMHDDAEAKVVDTAGCCSSYLQFQSPRVQPEPTVKGFGTNLSAFDMSELSSANEEVNNKSLVDEDGGSESPSFEINETIVYADVSTEENIMDCCGVSNALCGSENMFEGLVSDCGNTDSQRQAKERVNKVPSPRRKNLLSRLRKKKNKAASVGYANLDEDIAEQVREEMRGVKSANLQRTKQAFVGTSMAQASMFALLVDDEIDM